jgi:prepilin-type N-terminal cleavage/methylation domain-containing protein
VRADPTHPDDRPTPGRARRGFTLIELVVVVLLLAIVTGLIAPRLLDLSRRRADETARSVRNLLSIAAYRDAVGQQRISLEYSQTDRTLALLTLRAPPEGGAAAWLPDALIPPVALEGVSIRSAMLDGAALDPASWRVEFPRHQPRGSVELVLQSDAGVAGAGSPSLFVVSLLPSASEATLDAGAGAVPVPIDLDASGMGTSTW